MRLLLAVSVVVTFLVPRADAFEGVEHKELSNRALLAALKAAPVGSVDPSMADMARTFAGRSDHSFGAITEAVDWFTTPADDLLDPGEANRNYDGRDRWQASIKVLWAKHRNVDHFQRLALDEWAEYHAIALAAARDHCFPAALYAEAMALHYLQDFFAPGHVVTPRKGMHDVAAGSLHDYFNARGGDFLLFPARIEQTGVIPSLREQFPDEWLEFEAARLKKKVHFYGDGRLRLAGEEKVFLALISMLSIREVLAASTKTAVDWLQACFSPRWSPSKKGFDDKLEPNFLEFHAVQGGVRLISADRSLERVRTCDSSSSDWLGRFDLDSDLKLKDLSYRLSGAGVRTKAARGLESHDWRIDTDLLFLSSASDPKGALVDETGAPYPDGDNVHLIWLGPTFTRGSRYTAWGIASEGRYRTRYEGTTWGVDLAVRQYRHGAGSRRWRFEGGGSVTYGLSVVNLSAGLQHANTVTEDGKFVGDRFVTLAAEMVIAKEWPQLIPIVRVVTDLLKRMYARLRSSPPAAVPSK
ncbi:MAG: hypothetical protein AABO58_19970 [Acidobacteriota bacterium]